MGILCLKINNNNNNILEEEVDEEKERWGGVLNVMNMCSDYVHYMERDDE